VPRVGGEVWRHPTSSHGASLGQGCDHRLTWGVSRSRVRSSAHHTISGLGVRTASRVEPVSVLAAPNQNKLTSGRRTRQPHHDPACGGQGSGGRDHS
jgi:hypothetical protein